MAVVPSPRPLARPLMSPRLALGGTLPASVLVLPARARMLQCCCCGQLARMHRRAPWDACAAQVDDGRSPQLMGACRRGSFTACRGRVPACPLARGLHLLQDKAAGATCDGADDDDALERPLRRLLDVLQQQVGQQEVAQVVCACPAPHVRFSILRPSAAQQTQRPLCHRPAPVATQWALRCDTGSRAAPPRPQHAHPC